MKRLLLVLACALLLAIFGPVPAVAAHHWWSWGHHSKSSSSAGGANPGAAGAGASSPAAHKSKKNKTPKAHKQKKTKIHHSKSGNEPLYSVPKSVGWRRAQPGPAGYGAK